MNIEKKLFGLYIGKTAFGYTIFDIRIFALCFSIDLLHNSQMSWHSKRKE